MDPQPKVVSRQSVNTAMQYPYTNLLLAKSKFFKLYCSVDFFILSVCLSSTGHNSKPIIMKLHQVVEVVSTENPIDFEVKGHLEVKFLKSSFFIQLTWNLNKICILHHWIGKQTIFEVKSSKVKLLKSSIYILLTFSWTGFA